MKEIFIKYNPYKVKTDIKVDGKDVKTNSKLNVGEKRLQEWIEELPKILVDEFNIKSFKIKFNGTILDYEDLVSVCNSSKIKDIKIELEHIPGKEIGDKEKYIKEIFNEIQEGPFNELREPDINHSFKMASSSEFEVNVVATMSAGKSTLINALLGQKLMPAKQEACTATITKVKDKNIQLFIATTYDNNKKRIETYPNLNYETMIELNNKKNISTIEIEGYIPFVDSNDTSLVLVDTPGPNNARNLEHKQATYRMLSNSSKALIIYILNATQLTTNDNKELLNYISDSMKVGGKQSKDRFIFVINKLDTFKPGEDNVQGAINKVRKILEEEGINNPNIFPAAALPALDIRTILKDIDDLSKINPWDFTISPNIKEGASSVFKLNQIEELHLEKYSNLPPSIKREIESMLLEAKNKKDTKAQALIHTGIIPIELAIKMYINKYAKTAKIKNIAETFTAKLESARIFENTKQDIANNQNKKCEISKQIDTIKSKLKNLEAANEFEKKIDGITPCTEELIFELENIINQSQKKATKFCENDSKISTDEAKELCENLISLSQHIESEVKVKFEDTINMYVIENIAKVFDEYKQKILELVKELKIEDILIDPFELINGDIESALNIENLVLNSTQVEEVKIGEKWIKNDNVKLYKPWTWFQEWGHTEDIYQDIEFVKSQDISNEFLIAIEYNLRSQKTEAINYLEEKTNEIKDRFKLKFRELDNILSNKLEELEKYTNESNDREKMIEESKKRLEWIDKITVKVNSILDI